MTALLNCDTVEPGAVHLAFNANSFMGTQDDWDWNANRRPAGDKS